MNKQGRPPYANDDYCDELIEMQSLCTHRGLVFAHEMKWLCRAWRVMGEEVYAKKDATVRLPASGDDRTVAVRLIERVMSKKRDGDLAREVEEPINGPIDGPNDEPAARFARLPRNAGGPSMADLRGISPSRSLRVEAGVASVQLLRGRAAHVNEARKKAGNDLRLRCRAQPDGSVLIDLAAHCPAADDDRASCRASNHPPRRKRRYFLGGPSIVEMLNLAEGETIRVAPGVVEITVLRNRAGYVNFQKKKKGDGTRLTCRMQADDSVIIACASRGDHA